MWSAIIFVFRISRFIFMFTGKVTHQNLRLVTVVAMVTSNDYRKKKEVDPWSDQREIYKRCSIDHLCDNELKNEWKEVQGVENKSWNRNHFPETQTLQFCGLGEKSTQLQSTDQWLRTVKYTCVMESVYHWIVQHRKTDCCSVQTRDHEGYKYSLWASFFIEMFEVLEDIKSYFGTQRHIWVYDAWDMIEVSFFWFLLVLYGRQPFSWPSENTTFSCWNCAVQFHSKDLRPRYTNRALK